MGYVTKEQKREYQRKYYKKNREKLLLHNKKMRYKSKFGITFDTVQEMLSEQDGKCQICKVDITKRHYVDHNHATGEVRGLLCISCNAALGGFKDSPEVLQAAIAYLVEKGHYGQKFTTSP